MAVPDELLLAWSAAEAGVRFAAGDVPDKTQRLQVRSVILWTLQDTIATVGLPMEAWFEAASLLDHFVRAKGGSSLAELPVVSVVIVRMLKKESTVLRGERINFNALPHWVGQQLTNAGHPVSVNACVSQRELDECELGLLRTLQGRVALPTVASWTTVFFKRLDVLSGQRQSRQIRSAWHRTLEMAQVAVVQQASDAVATPQRVSRGLLTLSMAGERTAQVVVLGHLDSEIFEQLHMVTGVAANELVEDVHIAARVLGVGIVTPVRRESDEAKSSPRPLQEST